MPRREVPSLSIDTTNPQVYDLSVYWALQDVPTWNNVVRRLVVAPGSVRNQEELYVQVGIEGDGGDSKIHNLAHTPGVRRYNGPLVTITRENEVILDATRRGRWVPLRELR